MTNSQITKDTLLFLEQLKKNNNREWFTDHKEEFKAQENAAKQFFTSIQQELSTHDDIEKMKVFRIYRDVRFSKDKTPYKTHFGASFSRSGAHLRGGYYVQVQPGASFIATGFWAPNKEDLFRIRKELELDAQEFRDIINDNNFSKVWGSLVGEELKTAPKGFDKEHPDIDLIKKKQYIFIKKFTDKEVLSPNFLADISDAFKVIRPYFDLMSDVLTTNLNGESLIRLKPH